MSTHTPGPWNEAVSEYLYCPDIEQSQANARLMKAAPDMLAALKLADTILDGFPLYATGHGAKTIRAAIAKAEGKEP